MQSKTSKRILTSNLRWELFWWLFDILRQGLWDFWWIILSTHLFLVANPYLYRLDWKLPITGQRWMKNLYHLSLECEFQKNMSDQTCDLLNFAINKLQINRFFGILFICNKILAYWNIAIYLRRKCNKWDTIKYYQGLQIPRELGY